MRFLKKIFLPLAVTVAVVSVLPFISKESLAQKAGSAVPKKELNVIVDVFSMAQSTYVDEVSSQRLEEGAVGVRHQDAYGEVGNPSHQIPHLEVTRDGPVQIKARQAQIVGNEGENRHDDGPGGTGHNGLLQ